MIKLVITLIIVSLTLFADVNSKKIEQYKVLAQKGDKEALYKMGKIYYIGKSVKKNYVKSLKYFKRAAAKDHIKAQYSVAILYQNKKTPFHNYKKAYKIFLELAQDGYAPAQNRVGMFLTMGYGGVEKDYRLAVRWYTLASKQGNLGADCNLALMNANGMGVFPNFGRAHNFAKEGVKKKHPVCLKVWKNFHLEKYSKDKSFKYGYYK